MATTLHLTVPFILFFILLCPRSLLPSQEVQDSISLTALFQGSRPSPPCPASVSESKLRSLESAQAEDAINAEDRAISTRFTQKTFTGYQPILTNFQPILTNFGELCLDRMRKLADNYAGFQGFLCLCNNGFSRDFLLMCLLLLALIKELVHFKKMTMFAVDEPQERDGVQEHADRRRKIDPRLAGGPIDNLVGGTIDKSDRRGYFHRDLKPENLLVTKDVIKVADFGLAREICSQQISPLVQTHLILVFLSLGCVLVASAVGVYLHLLWNIDGMLTTLACFGNFLWLLSTPAYEAKTRVSLLMAAVFCAETLFDKMSHRIHWFGGDCSADGGTCTDDAGGDLLDELSSIKIMSVGLHMGQIQSVLRHADEQWRVAELKQQFEDAGGGVRKCTDVCKCTDVSHTDADRTSRIARVESS